VKRRGEPPEPSTPIKITIVPACSKKKWIPMLIKSFNAYIGLTLDIKVEDKFENDPNLGLSWYTLCPFRPTISID